MFGEELKKDTISLSADNIEYYVGKDGSAYFKPIGNWIADKNLFERKFKDLNDLRDEYHSIGELYEFRKAYNALLFNEWATEPFSLKQLREGHNITFNDNQQFKPKYDVHKSWRHNDGELCFGGGWFIVVAMLPSGQITNHYKAEYWDLFQIPEVDKAKYEFDGHTPADTLERMKQLLNTK